MASITSEVLRDIRLRPERIHRAEYVDLLEFVCNFRVPDPPSMPPSDLPECDEEEECPPPLSPIASKTPHDSSIDIDDCTLMHLVQEAKEKGRALFNDGHYTEALAEFSSVVSIRPSAISYCWRARCFSKLGRLTEALSDVDCAIARTPDYHAAYHLRGRILFDMEDYRRAIESLSTGQQYEADPESAAMINVCREKNGAETASPPGVSPGKQQEGSSSSPSCTPPRDSIPDLSAALSGMDLDQIMKNPQMQKMAEQMMSDPAFINNLMGSFQNATG